MFRTKMQNLLTRRSKEKVIRNAAIIKRLKKQSYIEQGRCAIAAELLSRQINNTNKNRQKDFKK